MSQVRHTGDKPLHVRERKQRRPAPIELVHLYLLSPASMGLESGLLQHPHRPRNQHFEESQVGLMHPVRRKARGRVEKRMVLPKRLSNGNVCICVYLYVFICIYMVQASHRHPTGTPQAPHVFIRIYMYIYIINTYLYVYIYEYIPGCS